MRTGLTVTRELASAGKDLLLALPRHVWEATRAKRRRAAFLELETCAPPPSPALQPPRGSLQRILLSCGDVSGEAHARRLLAVLRSRHPELKVAGFGSRRMAAEGMQVWEPLADLNVMGFRDVARQFPLFFGCVARFTRELRRQRPDAVVLIDYPGLNRHLLRITARAGVPVIDYIAPQLWAWAPWRVRDFRRADRLLTILPFENDWYRRHGARPEFVGHPLGDGLEEAAAEEPSWSFPSAPESAVASEPGTTGEARNSKEWVGILPGSRRREIRENLPVLLQAASELKRHRPQVRFVLPHLRDDVWPLIRDILQTSPVEVIEAPGRYHRVLPGLKAAWVASGTALLEVAAHRVPPVLIYKLSSGLAEWLAPRLLAVPYVGSINLIAGRELAPEHLSLTPDPIALARDLEARLQDPIRGEVLDALDALAPHFARPGAAKRAAAWIEDQVSGSSGQRAQDQSGRQ